MTDSKKLHDLAAFYPNGDMVKIQVPDRDLDAKLAYDAAFRPGRFLFVDGEYHQGGILAEPARSRFIEKCKARLEAGRELNQKEGN